MNGLDRSQAQRLGEYAVLVLAALLTAWLLVAVIWRAAGSGDYAQLATRLEQQHQQEPESNGEESTPQKSDKDKPKEKDKPKDKAAETKEPSVADEQVKRITERSLFAPVPKKTLGARLIGVLGNEAFFAGGKSAKVGGQIGGAKVVALGPDWVDLEWEGKTIKQWVFSPRKLPPKMPEGYVVPPDIIERAIKLSAQKIKKVLARLPQPIQDQITVHLQVEDAPDE